MKKLILLLPALLLISTLQLTAQESIGYTDPDDFQYLLDYRLPDWGYSNFFISSTGFNAQGSYLNTDQQNGNPGDLFFSRMETDQARHNLGIGISPRFELYRESEKRTISLNMFSNLGSSFRKNNSDIETTFGDDETKSRSSSQAFNYGLDVSHNFYGSQNVFLITDLSARIRYDKDFTKDEFNNNTTNEVTIRTRNINFSPTLGIGFGRIRNVTPIIRAIRVNERYKELGNSSFNGSEIRNTAETFTKVQGYQRTRDRFLKDFWNDVNTGVNGKLDQIGAFDLFYLNDVFNENLGSRFEGYEASLSVDYNYVNQLFKEDNEGNNTEDRNLTINRAANVNIDFDWFKNLNLYHQVSIRAGNTFTFPLEQSDTNELISLSSIDAQWLWNFADRFQLTTDLLNRFVSTKPKENFGGDFSSYSSQLRTNLFYFVESKIALNAGAGLTYFANENEFNTNSISNNQFQWTLNAGISYYFNRNLY